MARPKNSEQSEESAQVVETEQKVEVQQEKTIKFTCFKIYTSRGRRLKDDVGTFPVDEADKLIADGNAVECT